MFAQFSASLRARLTGRDEASRLTPGCAKNTHNQTRLLDFDHLHLELAALDDFLTCLAGLALRRYRMKRNATLSSIDMMNDHLHLLARCEHRFRISYALDP